MLHKCLPRVLSSGCLALIGVLFLLTLATAWFEATETFVSLLLLPPPAITIPLGVFTIIGAIAGMLSGQHAYQYAMEGSKEIAISVFIALFFLIAQSEEAIRVTTQHAFFETRSGLAFVALLVGIAVPMLYITAVMGSAGILVRIKKILK